MGTKRVYEIGNFAILQYYNLVGIDVRNLGINVMGRTEVDEIEELSPSNKYDLPESSQLIDQQVQSFLYTACNDFGFDDDSLKHKKEFVDSFWKIVNTCTNLNLTKDFDDPQLHFERLNTVIHLTLYSLNKINPMDIIQIGRLLNKGDFNRLFALASEYSIIYLLLIAMSKDADLPDYTMFESDESAKIDYKKMFELLKKAIAKKIKVMKIFLQV